MFNFFTWFYDWLLRLFWYAASCFPFHSIPGSPSSYVEGMENHLYSYTPAYTHARIIRMLRTDWLMVDERKLRCRMTALQGDGDGCDDCGTTECGKDFIVTGSGGR